MEIFYKANGSVKRTIVDISKVDALNRNSVFNFVRYETFNVTFQHIYDSTPHADSTMIPTISKSIKINEAIL